MTDATPDGLLTGGVSTPAAPTGSIYDIGYRRYEGPRLGRGLTGQPRST